MVEQYFIYSYIYVYACMYACVRHVLKNLGVCVKGNNAIYGGCKKKNGETRKTRATTPAKWKHFFVRHKVGVSSLRF